MGCYVDRSQSQDCVGIGDTVYSTAGRTRIKITLAGYLVYLFDIWVGDLSGQEAILGMDFMVPAGIRLDLADGSPCLPDEVRIQLSGRRQLYNDKARIIRLDQHLQIDVGDSTEVPMRRQTADQDSLWVTRGNRWVPTVSRGPGQMLYLTITNIGDKKLILQGDERIAMWLAGDRMPRLQGFVTVGSRRYLERQNLALQATTNAKVSEKYQHPEQPDLPAVERPTYPTPRAILRKSNPGSDRQLRSGEQRFVLPVQVAVGLPDPEAEVGDSTPTPQNGDLESTTSPDLGGQRVDGAVDESESQSMMGAASDSEECRKEVEEPIPEAAPSDPTPGGTTAEIAIQLEDEQVCYHEGGDLIAEEVESGMAVLPEVTQATEDVTIEDIQVGDPTVNSADEIDRLRQLIWRRRHLLIGKGNALPPAARGIVCDIDVGGAKPIAQRMRKVAPQFREKLSDLIKGLLGARIINMSTSPWASPIVVIIKKNGVDIRLCIDYRLVNSLTRLMIYPMPLINDLLEDLDKVLWYSFITHFGLFEWNRMPFGLKNAPQIYQRMLDNALYGFTRIPRLEKNPARKQPDPEASPDLIPSEPKDDDKKSVLGRRSYIDDILITAESWDHLCKRVEGLLEVCDEWNLSISVVKSFWGKNRVEYLGHKVSSHGLEANPKDLSALTELPFPGSLRAMQSFLGSLNYYSKFIEDYAIYAAVLYKLRDVDFAAMSKPETRSRIQKLAAAVGDDREETGRSAEADLRWIWAQKSFSKLKEKVASTPILRHFRPELQPVVVVYANDWAISAALMQEHDDVFHPVMFASRTLKSNELNYGIVEKEVLALLRVLDPGHNLLVGREIKVLARYSTLAWLFRSSGLQGRLGQWAALLSPWTLEIVKCTKGEDEILGTIAATITPRAEVDQALIAIAPQKEPRRKIQAPIPTVYPGESLWVVSFDGSARVKRGGGAYSAILWKLPEWTVVKARSEYVDGLTVNEAEYRGLLLCMDLLEGEDQQRLVICGDSNLVIRQVRGEIDCKAPGLTILRQKALDRLLAWPDHELLHVKRDWNGSADSLAGAALQRQAGVEVEEDSDFEDLVTLNRLEEILVAKEAEEHPSAKINPVATRTTGDSRSLPTVLQEEVVRDLRIGRIKQTQDEEVWIAGLKKYLLGAVHDLPPEDVKSYHTVGSDYEVDLDGLLFYCPPAKRTTEERDGLMRLVVPEMLQQDVLHHYHSSLEGGHQGIGRTYQRIRDHFHWRGFYRSVQRYVGECVDCETGKGRPTLQGESPGNIQATYPFQIIAMDHIPSLPKSHKGNPELLIWVDLFTGYVIAKASASRTAQTIAESYEECAFRRFGASEVIRHDREPGFMADFFRSFNKILGQRQRATMAYRPQANGTAERMVQNTTRALKMYVQELDQRDWDEYAERLTFAINTAQDRIRGETPFYL
ncbi:hypothetical protein PR003_g24588, partial [Phytophthora rubi]